MIYLVPHTHYDAIWVFNREDYFHINIELIIKEAVELALNTDYRFLIEQTFLLETVEKRYPELFKRLKKAIKENKIEIADGEYLMADTMLPQGETLVREILVGKRYVHQKFGVPVPVMWQADSFGLNAQLPQIYKRSGYKYLAFRRGVDRKKPSEFLWEGLDGTKILTHWMPLGYRAGLDLTKLEESYEKLKNLAATSSILMPSGSGVTVPQPETSAFVKMWNEKHDTKMKIATPGQFFDALEKESKDLETRKGEMYSAEHSDIFSSCCSSRMWIKQGLADYENQLMSLERWSTISYLLGGYYPSDELAHCWKKILFLAFHDVVPGTGMDRCYDEVKQDLDFLETTLSTLSQRIFTTIVENETDEDKERGDLIVFNSLSWEVKNWVEMELTFDKGKIMVVKGLASGDEEIEVEIIKFARYSDDSLRYVKIGFVPSVPALGYKVYKILEREPMTGDDPNYIRIRGNTVRNRFFGVEIDPGTGLINVIQGKGEKICSANELVIEEEIGDLYYHKQTLDIPLKTERGEGIKYGSFKMGNFRIDKSQLRRIINVETDYFSLRWPYRLTEKMEPIIWRHKFLRCIKKIVVYKDIPRIDFITNIDNRHPRARIRLRFSTEIKSPNYACGTQFGVVSRPTNKQNFPSIMWLSYADKKKGLTVIHRGIPENEVRDGDIFLTLLRSVSMLSSDGSAGPVIPVPDAQELKSYLYEYSVYPHEGDWRDAESYKQAHQFNFPLQTLQLPKDVNIVHKRSFLKIEPENVVLSALKKAEDGDNVIIRFYETKGEETDARITFFTRTKVIKPVNLLEQEDEQTEKTLKKNGNGIELKIKPFEIVGVSLLVG